jgi:hypothetical protein
MKKETRGRKRQLTGAYFKFHVSAQGTVVRNLQGIDIPKYILFWRYGFRDIEQIKKHKEFTVNLRPRGYGY